MIATLLHFTAFLEGAADDKPKKNDEVRVNCFEPTVYKVHTTFSLVNGGATNSDCFDVELPNATKQWIKVEHGWSLQKNTIIGHNNKFYKLTKDITVMPTKCVFFADCSKYDILVKNTTKHQMKLTCDQKQCILEKNMCLCLSARDLPNLKLHVKDGKFINDGMFLHDSWKMLHLNKNVFLEHKGVTFQKDSDKFLKDVAEKSTQIFCFGFQQLDSFLRDNNSTIRPTTMCAYGFEDTVQLLEDPEFEEYDANTVQTLKEEKKSLLEMPYKEFYEDKKLMKGDEEFDIDRVFMYKSVEKLVDLPKLVYCYDFIKNDNSIDQKKKSQLWQIDLLFVKLEKQKMLDGVIEGSGEKTKIFFEQNYGKKIEPKDIDLKSIQEFLENIDVEKIKQIQNEQEKYLEIGKLYCFLGHIKEFVKESGKNTQAVATVLESKLNEVTKVFSDAWKWNVQRYFEEEVQKFRYTIGQFVGKRERYMVAEINCEFRDISKKLNFYRKHGVENFISFRKAKEFFDSNRGKEEGEKEEEYIEDVLKAISKEIDDELENKTEKDLDGILKIINEIKNKIEIQEEIDFTYDQKEYDEFLKKAKLFADYKTSVEKKARDLQDKAEREAKDLQDKADKAAQLAKDLQKQADDALKTAKEAEKTGDKDKATKAAQLAKDLQDQADKAVKDAKDLQDKADKEDKAAKDTSGTEKKTDATKDDESETEKMSTGMIIGIVLGVLGAVCVAAAVGWFIWKKNISKEVIAVGEKKEEEI